jgi:lipopolysaccharide transport system ATP-binding protein
LLWALKSVSFEVKRGEVLGVIGRNGAGKSTLLKILSRITEPTEGCVEIHGRVGSLLEVGTGFHSELTGRENIFLNGAILGMKKAEVARKFDEIVAFAEVEKFLDTPVKHYSSGMYMRLAFAVAAHFEPEILLVDEVLAVGDAAFQKKCIGKIRAVAGVGRTVVFVSHNMGAVNSLCTRALCMANGKIQAVGPTQDVVSDYLSELLQNTKKDLDKLRFAGCGKEVRFSDIRLISHLGASVAFGQPLEFSLDVAASSNIRDLTIGAGIFDVTGACVGTLFTEEKFSVEANQKITLRLVIANLCLAPGPYYAGFSIGRGGWKSRRHDFDIVRGAPTFQVLPISETGENVSHWHADWGNIVILNAQLKIEKE